MKKWIILAVLAALTVGCASGMNREPLKNTFKVYATDQRFEDVAERFRGLLTEQTWLRWITRSGGCFEHSNTTKDQWMFQCGFTPAFRGYFYQNWIVVLRREPGAEILMTKPVRILFSRYHPNAEILEKAGIGATFVEMRSPD